MSFTVQKYSDNDAPIFVWQPQADYLRIRVWYIVRFINRKIVYKKYEKQTME